jgi:predicted phosphoribosyltransferase
VLAIPRGGVVIGRAVADQLDAPLDVIVPRKLRAPFNTELAIGAIAEGDALFLEDEIAHGVGAAYLDEEIATQRREIERRVAVYRGGRALPSIAGRTVIVVDDGIATGATMIAALRAVRRLEPAELVAAVPVAPPEGVARLAREADEIVCLAAPALFHAVGQFYDDFAQVEDHEVRTLLGTGAPAPRRADDDGS